jgi:8-oxo-dGTP diphosphatase
MKRKGEIMTVNFYEDIDDKLLKFAVIVAVKDGKYIFCKHKFRDTLEIPGGHREHEEMILDTAKRELYEETGAIDFNIQPVCVYSVIAEDNFDGEETFGMLYFATVKQLEPKLHNEIEKIVITHQMPSAWTYPDIQPKLFEEARRRGFC